MLLILTSKTDLTADFLIVELLKRQLPYFRLNAEDLHAASFQFSVDSDGIARQISVGPRTLDLSEVKAVWYRRAIQPVPPPTLSASERWFLAGEFRHLTMGLVLNPNLLWVNPIDRVAVAEHKLYQLQIAQRIGLRIPRTVVSSDLFTLQNFIDANPAGTICKPIFHGMFVDEPDRYSVYTRRIEREALDADALGVCPVLLQEEIVRISDVRATFIGRHCFVADIKGGPGVIDWRDPAIPVEYSISGLSNEVRGMCRSLLGDLGLTYGAFDFVRTPNNELVFLEVNPTGEWAWLEDRLGFPMRDAFIELFFGGSK